jgi:hypothetical protein
MGSCPLKYSVGDRNKRNKLEKLWKYCGVSHNKIYKNEIWNKNPGIMEEMKDRKGVDLKYS